MKFFSQFAQDRFLLEYFFRGRRGGVFVDIGANDGEKHSNTLFFEQTMGWTGLCVEPSGCAFVKLKTNRRVICEQASIADFEGEAEFADDDAATRQNVSQYVPVTRLSSLLQKHSLFQVDYCSISPEGAQLGIFSHLDLSRFRTSVFTVKNTDGQEYSRSLMAENGYELFAKLGRYDVFHWRDLKPLTRDPVIYQQTIQLLRQGWELQRQGRLDDAERAYDQVLMAAPANPDALHFLGLIKAQRGSAEAGAAMIALALAVNPNNPAPLFNYASVLRGLKRHDEAIASYDHVLALKPDHARALADRGSALHELGKLNEALDSYDRALAIESKQAATLYNRGNALRSLGRKEEALISYDRALAINHNHAGALSNRATLLEELKRYDDALVSYNYLVRANPRNLQALTSRGDVLLVLNRYHEALASYDDALAVSPNDAAVLNARGHVLTRSMQHDDALVSFSRALAISPNDIRALVNRGTLLAGLRRYEEASKDFERALELEPERQYLRGTLFECKIHCCDWRSIEREKSAIACGLEAGKRVIRPMININASPSQEAQLRCARIWIENEFPASAPLWRGETYRHDRIRIAYFSAEVGFNPVATQMAAIFENHDKDRFETTLVSFGRDDGNAMRARIESAFERVIDVRSMSDFEAASLLREMEVDIAIDLAGLTGNCRTGILACRPAPVQVNYLGFPATMGAEYIDYIIADRFAAPFSDQPHFGEKIVHLPDTLMPNDFQRSIAQRSPTRHEAGLPEGCFVFCCFNNSFKFTPEMFDVWMRLLGAIENSVLWLPDVSHAVVRNLKGEAQNRGISPERLVFAPFVGSAAEHLARLRLADLCLDTLPYNAHATACDALWAGLPVLTCMGNTLAGRVAAGLLNAVGLPELVTDSLDAYEATALNLARDPDALAAIRAKLARNRTTFPLFDTTRFTRHLEAAFTEMWQRSQLGEAPASFSVKNLM